MDKSLKEKKIDIIHAWWLTMRKTVNFCKETELQIDTVDTV